MAEVTFDKCLYLCIIYRCEPHGTAQNAAAVGHEIREEQYSPLVQNLFGFRGQRVVGSGTDCVGGNTAVSQIVMCDPRGNITAAGGNSAARLFVVTPLGRATIVRDQDMIGTALTNMGETCP